MKKNIRRLRRKTNVSRFKLGGKATRLRSAAARKYLARKSAPKRRLRAGGLIGPLANRNLIRGRSNGTRLMRNIKRYNRGGLIRTSLGGALGTNIRITRTKYGIILTK